MVGNVVPLLLLAAAASVTAQEPPLDDAMTEMGIEFRLPPGATFVPRVDQADVIVQVAFAYPGAAYEVRCAFLPLSFLGRECRGGDVDDYVPVFAFIVFDCLTKGGARTGRVEELPPESVRREFRADFGMTALLPGEKCDFTRGYRFVVATLLYRRGVGVAIVFLLYNDPADLGMDKQPFADAYYCFQFAE